MSNWCFKETEYKCRKAKKILKFFDRFWEQWLIVAPSWNEDDFGNHSAITMTFVC